MLMERLHALEEQNNKLRSELIEYRSLNKSDDEYLQSREVILNSLEDPVILIDLRGCLISWNTAVKILASDCEAGMPLGDILPENITVKILQLIAADFSSHLNETLEFAFNEEYFIASIRQVSKRLFDKEAFLIHLKKITRTRQYFNRNLVQETRLRKILDNESDVVFLINEKGNILLVNGNPELLGIYKQRAVPGNPVMGVFGNENHEVFNNTLRDALSNYSHSPSFEIEIKQGGGISYFYEIHIRNLLLDTTVAGLVVSVKDITEQRKAKELLSRNEARFKSLIRNITDVISMVNDKAIFTFVSPAFYRILGYKEFEVIGRSTIDFIHPDDRFSMIKSIRETIERPGTITTVVCRFRHRFGHYLIVENICQSLLHDPLVQALVINSRDITERKITEDKLKYNSAMLQNIFDESPDAIILNTITGRKVINCNKKTFELFRIPGQEEIIGKKADQFRVVRMTTDEEIQIQELLNRGETYTREVQFRTWDGEKFYGLVTLKKISVNGVPYELKRVSDITYLKSFENSLKLQQQRHNLHIRQTPLGYIEWDLRFRVAEWNQAAERIFGYNAREITGKHVSQLIPELTEESTTLTLEELLKTEGVSSGSSDNLHKSGKIIKCEWYNTPLVNNDGKLVGYTSMVMDVTEQFLSNRAIQESLKEKEVMLSEIHHRVKNNLAVVSGLLYLQSEGIKDEKLKSVFLESQMRIKSISLIHEKLYQSESFSAINIRNYLTDLASGIIGSFSGMGNKIHLELGIQSGDITMNEALSYGLILNELITNSIKYAFKDIEHPSISISWTISDTQKIFEYADNGPGFEFKTSDFRKGSIGLELIKTLVRQVKGKLEYSNNKGSVFTITVKKI